MTARVQIFFKNGASRSYICSISPHEAAMVEGRYIGKNSVEEQEETQFEVAERILKAEGIDLSAVRGFEIQVASLNSPPSAAQSLTETAEQPQRVRQCRSLLSLAKAVLPKDVREDAIDEWMDEIECAAAEDRPVLRRAISILVRSLPVLAWRSRLPRRARRPGGE